MTATDDDIKALEEALAKATDTRPENCRHRLQEEGKAYPRSGCTACGATIMTGLGRSCSHGAVRNITPTLIARLRAAEARLLPEKLTDKQREMLARAVMEWGSSEDWVSLSDHMKGVYRGMANDFHAILSRIQKEPADG